MISFGISWENYIRTTSSPDNWDAVWVFVKYRVDNGVWRHATLSAVPEEYSGPAGVTVNPAGDRKGVFIYPENQADGAFHIPGISIRWNHREDNVPDGGNVEVRVLGLEMTYIPGGRFYAGDFGHSGGSFRKGSNDNRPWEISGEGPIHVTDTPSDGYYYISSKDFWSDIWNISEDLTGSEFTIPAAFPKGYRAIYCMKYELTQQQYADFLNLLTPAQAANRYDSTNYNQFGYSIRLSGGRFTTEHPQRACGFITPADLMAFADWSGLRPMTELEFEKICRGSGNRPLPGEFPWGTTHCVNATDINGSESDRETVAQMGANAYFQEPGFQPALLLTVGTFSRPGASREECGATHYGVLDMGGNVNEMCITVGNRYGRHFPGTNGDGQLTVSGDTNQDNWPGNDGKGTGYRGGCIGQEMSRMRVSDRIEANVEIEHDHRHIPWGIRCVRTVL